MSEHSSPQFRMTGMRPTSLANSRTVSVLPTPASPRSAAPLLHLSEVTRLSQQRSVLAVMMNRELMPFYSQPYFTFWSSTDSLISEADSPSRLNLNIVLHSHEAVEVMFSSDSSCSYSSVERICTAR